MSMKLPVQEAFVMSQLGYAVPSYRDEIFVF